MAATDSMGYPEALPLVFTHESKWYSQTTVNCIFANDSFTELLNEDYDSYVMNPWSWNKHDEGEDVVKLSVIPIAVVTMITNMLVITTFVKEKMLSALNIILIAMAISDTLTVLIPSIAILYMYVDGVWPDYIPFEYCRIWGYFTKYLPTITHTASVWLTVILAFDRYLAVRHPFLVRRICFPKRSVLLIIAVYIFATLGHLCRFIDTNYIPVKIISTSSLHAINGSNFINNSSDICNAASGKHTCRASYPPFLKNMAAMYELSYHWFVIIFVKFIPCTCLIVIDTLMLKSLRNSEQLRNNITATRFDRNFITGKKRLNESLRMTTIIIIVIIIVVIVELPIGVVLIFWTLATVHGTDLLSESTINALSRAANMLVYVSYPIIFILYCCISAKFRKSICRWCCCRKRSFGQDDRELTPVPL